MIDEDDDDREVELISAANPPSIYGYGHRPYYERVATVLEGRAEPDDALEAVARPGGEGAAVHLDLAELPALPLRVHPERDGGAGGQAGGEELERRRRRVAPAGGGRLVGGHPVGAHRALHLVLPLAAGVDAGGQGAFGGGGHLERSSVGGRGGVGSRWSRWVTAA